MPNERVLDSIQTLKTHQQFQEAWFVSHRINLQLLAAIGDENLGVSYAPRARNVRRIFVHLHNTRLNWLGAVLKNPPELARLKTRDAHDVAALSAALDASANAVGEMLRKIVKRESVRGFDRSPATFLAFMIAHEAHHRGQAILALRQAGKALPRHVLADLWDWDQI